MGALFRVVFHQGFHCNWIAKDGPTGFAEDGHEGLESSRGVCVTSRSPVIFTICDVISADRLSLLLNLCFLKWTMQENKLWPLCTLVWKILINKETAGFSPLWFFYCFNVLCSGCSMYGGRLRSTVIDCVCCHWWWDFLAWLKRTPSKQAGPKTETKMWKYFHLQALCCCSVNVYVTKILLCFRFHLLKVTRKSLPHDAVDTFATHAGLAHEVTHTHC